MKKNLYPLKVFSTLRALREKLLKDRLSEEEQRLIESYRKAKNEGQKVPVDLDVLNALTKSGPFSSLEDLWHRLTIIVVFNPLSIKNNGTDNPRKRSLFLTVVFEVLLALFSGLATYLLF